MRMVCVEGDRTPWSHSQERRACLLVRLSIQGRTEHERTPVPAVALAPNQCCATSMTTEVPTCIEPYERADGWDPRSNSRIDRFASLNPSPEDRFST